MRALLLLLTFFASLNLLAQATLLGRITAENAEPLAGANVWLEPLKIGAQTGPDGRFEIRDLPQGPIKVTVSYIGFAPRTESLSLKTDEIIEIDWVLHSQSQLLSDVIVSATRAGNATPMAYTNLNREQLSRNNLGQDVPFLLQWTPSAVVTSDAGTGIGYTGIRIRGSDPTRINVTINGIPLNDAESQGVYWVDLPDFLSSTSDVQIQRGAGTSTNGAGAFGASIHLNTATPSTDPYAIIAASAGSFDTYKGSVSFGSGRLGAGFSLDGRYSMIRSNGYIDRASADLQSYYISGAYTGEQQSLRLNVFSGHERTYQAWNGVPVQYVNDPVLRTYNTAGLEKPGEPYENEVDDYTQTHYQALYFRDLGQDWRANVNLHYTRGKGYYEQYKAAESPADYGLAPVNAGGEMLTSADLVRRLWLDNHFYGLTYGLFYEKNAVDLTLGGGWNQYRGGHYGDVISSPLFALDNGVHRFYENDATKTDLNIFGKMHYRFAPEWTGYLDLQYRQVQYDFSGVNRQGNEVDQTADLHFFNPKAGLFWEIKSGQNLYASFAVANREPNRNDYTGSLPDNRPRPESLYDAELGWKVQTSRTALEINGFYMHYTDQLAVNGQLNDVGEALRINIPKSYRAGVEFSAAQKLATRWQLAGNLTLSDNRIPEWTEYIDNWETGLQEAVVHRNTQLAFSPSLIAGGELAWDAVKGNGEQPVLNLALLGKYVGRQYLDNTSNQQASLDPYAFADARIRWTFQARKGTELQMTLLVNNLLNAQYAANGWAYRFLSPAYDPRPDDPYAQLERGDLYHLIGLYPQAGRHFLLGLTVSF